MMARLRKEARALLPYWAGTLALVVAPYLAGSDGAVLSWFTYCFGCALIGGVVFGHEFRHGTLPLMLSQPIARTVVWRDKMLVLATAMLTITAALVAAATVTHSPSPFYFFISAGQEHVRVIPLIPLCIFGGAPLMTLLSASELGGAILSLAVPGCCLTLAMTLHWLFPALAGGAVTALLEIVWCPSAIVLSFLRWRTYQARPPRATAFVLGGASSSPRSGPLGALLRKELRLQYGTFVLALVLWVLFFVGGVIAEAGRDWSDIATAVTGVDLFVLPLIAGAVALGVERSLGVADWQLSLPPSARAQWLAKMLVTLPTTLLLGLVIPLFLQRALPDAKTLAVLVVAHLLLTHLALYAGSIANGTMPAALLALAFWSVTGVAVLYGGLLHRLGGPPKLTIAMAALLLLLHAFAFANFRMRRLRPRRLAFQGLSVGALIGFFAAIS